jgi:hypothetical protein
MVHAPGEEVAGPAGGRRESTAFVMQAIPLLKEYHAKLVGVHERLQSFADKSTYDRFYYPGRDRIVKAEAAVIDAWYVRFEPAARRLAQLVSGMIDQGAISVLHRAELELRLAEFEAELKAIPALLAVYRGG